MQRKLLSVLTALGGAVLLSQCQPADSPTAASAELTPGPRPGGGSVITGVPAVPVAGHLVVCKEGTAADFVLSWFVEEPFHLEDGECADVHDWPAGITTSVTITEVLDPGYTLESITQELVGGGGGTITGTNSVSGNLAGNLLTFHNTPETAPGRMTGGGHQLSIDGARVTRGLTLHCDITLSNNLEINWPGGNKWHLDKENLEFVTCIDDPNFNPVPPAAPFDTFIARGIGSLNGEFGVGGSIIDFRFIDDGEPGSTDEAHFTIYAVDQGPGQVAPGDEVIVLQVSGQLDGGNLQAHFDQPHK